MSDHENNDSFKISRFPPWVHTMAWMYIIIHTITVLSVFQVTRENSDIFNYIKIFTIALLPILIWLSIQNKGIVIIKNGKIWFKNKSNGKRLSSLDTKRYLRYQTHRFNMYRYFDYIDIDNNKIYASCKNLDQIGVILKNQCESYKEDRRKCYLYEDFLIWASLTGCLFLSLVISLWLYTHLIE